MEVKKCSLCPNPADHSHHIKPVHLGGDPNGPQTLLCANCHTKLHRCSNNLFRNKPIDEDSIWLAKARPLINRIVVSMFEAETKDLSRVESRIILKVPKGKLRRIHRRKTDLGFSSLEKYFAYLLEKDLPID